mgnify:CR=1 FL=1
MGETKKLRGEGHILIEDVKAPVSFDLSISKTKHGFEGSGSLTLSFEYLLEVQNLQNPVQLHFGSDKVLNLDLGSSRGNVIEVVGLRRMPD